MLTGSIPESRPPCPGIRINSFGNNEETAGTNPVIRHDPAFLPGIS
jgi:hypothetical protein